jgi:hypothetical protein
MAEETKKRLDSLVDQLRGAKGNEELQKQLIQTEADLFRYTFRPNTVLLPGMLVTRQLSSKGDYESYKRIADAYIRDIKSLQPITRESLKRTILRLNKNPDIPNKTLIGSGPEQNIAFKLYPNDEYYAFDFDVNAGDIQEAWKLVQVYEHIVQLSHFPDPISLMFKGRSVLNNKKRIQKEYFESVFVPLVERPTQPSLIQQIKTGKFTVEQIVNAYIDLSEEQKDDVLYHLQILLQENPLNIGLATIIEQMYQKYKDKVELRQLFYTMTTAQSISRADFTEHIQKPGLDVVAMQKAFNDFVVEKINDDERVKYDPSILEKLKGDPDAIFIAWRQYSNAKIFVQLGEIRTKFIQNTRKQIEKLYTAHTIRLREIIAEKESERDDLNRRLTDIKTSLKKIETIGVSTQPMKSVRFTMRNTSKNMSKSASNTETIGAQIDTLTSDIGKLQTQLKPIEQNFRKFVNGNSIKPITDATPPDFSKTTTLKLDITRRPTMSRTIR